MLCADAPVAGVHITTPVHADLIGWAVDCFDAADLQVPPVIIGVYDDEAQCQNPWGTYVNGVVSVCSLYSDPVVQEANRRRVLLHELAHRWIEANVDAETIDEFMEMRGISEWDQHSTPWKDRGVEQAAEAIAWGMADYPLYPHPLFDDRSYRGLHDAYVALVGSEPPFGYPDYCE